MTTNKVPKTFALESKGTIPSAWKPLSRAAERVKFGQSLGVVDHAVARRELAQPGAALLFQGTPGGHRLRQLREALAISKYQLVGAQNQWREGAEEDPLLRQDRHLIRYAVPPARWDVGQVDARNFAHAGLPGLGRVVEALKERIDVRVRTDLEALHGAVIVIFIRSSGDAGCQRAADEEGKERDGDGG